MGTLLSGNTIGAIYWSNGNRVAPMLPKRDAFTKCTCGHFFWQQDSIEIGEICYNQKEVNETWKNASRFNERFHEEFIKKTPELTDKQLLYLRKMIWWNFGGRVSFEEDRLKEMKNEIFKVPIYKTRFKIKELFLFKPHASSVLRKLDPSSKVITPNDPAIDLFIQDAKNKIPKTNQNVFEKFKQIEELTRLIEELDASWKGIQGRHTLIEYSEKVLELHSSIDALIGYFDRTYIQLFYDKYSQLDRLAKSLVYPSANPDKSKSGPSLSVAAHDLVAVFEVQDLVHELLLNSPVEALLPEKVKFHMEDWRKRFQNFLKCRDSLLLASDTDACATSAKDFGAALWEVEYRFGTLFGKKSGIYERKGMRKELPVHPFFSQMVLMKDKIREMKSRHQEIIDTGYLDSDTVYDLLEKVYHHTPWTEKHVLVFKTLLNRMKKEEEKAQISNLKELVKMLDESDPNEKIMKAEAFRNMGEFSEALKLLATIGSPPKVIEEMKRRAKSKDRGVFETTALLA